LFVESVGGRSWNGLGSLQKPLLKKSLKDVLHGTIPMKKDRALTINANIKPLFKILAVSDILGIFL